MQIMTPHLRPPCCASLVRCKTLSAGHLRILLSCLVRDFFETSWQLLIHFQAVSKKLKCQWLPNPKKDSDWKNRPTLILKVRPLYTWTMTIINKPHLALYKHAPGFSFGFDYTSNEEPSVVGEVPDEALSAPDNCKTTRKLWFSNFIHRC